jgi:hydrogenase-4 component F
MPWTGTLFLVGTIAVTGTPPFSLFQSEFTALQAAFAAGQPWSAAIFVIGVVTIFAGMLVRMSRLSLGTPTLPLPIATARECPWKLGAMLLVLVPTVLLGFVLPDPLFRLIQSAANLVGGAP